MRVHTARHSPAQSGSETTHSCWLPATRHTQSTMHYNQHNRRRKRQEGADHVRLSRSHPDQVEG
jgi:hypothetical protein